MRAQGFRVSGRVFHVANGDSVPAGREWAVLHRVTRGGGAPVDSQMTDVSGRYRVWDASPDTAAAYIVSVRFEGIAYFSDPFDAAAESVPPIAVYDTSSTTPAVVLRERHVLVRRPEVEAGRRVIEVLVLANDGDHTRVAGDDRPVWSGALPEEGAGFEVGTSDVSEDAITFADGTISVFAPVPPGERQIVIGYLVGAERRQLHVPVDQPTGMLNVLAEDTDATFEGEGFTEEPPSDIQGTTFRQWTAFDVLPGGPAVLNLPAGSRSGMPWMLPVVVVLAALGLSVGFVWWWRRYGGTGGMVTAMPVDDTRALAAQIAELDRTHAGRDDDEYRARRLEMKKRLETMLAQRSEPE